MIQLGAKVKDRVTGYSGIVIGRTEYLNGCVQYCVKTRMKDGKLVEGEWIDEGQLAIMNGGLSVKRKKAGGPQSDTAPERYRG